MLGIYRLGEKQKGPEYETLVGFGPNLMLNDLVFATRMGDLCDRYGIDTISASNTIGLAFLLYAQGRLTAADTGGVELEWGNSQAVEALVHQIGRKEWFGVRLAEGARLLGKQYGAEAEAVQVNGLEAAYHDPAAAVLGWRWSMRPRHAAPAITNLISSLLRSGRLTRPSGWNCTDARMGLSSRPVLPIIKIGAQPAMPW